MSNEQFRLRKVQLFNWGTFSGVVDLDVAAEGFLFVGPSGSGKSSILDAHAALLTPPKWLDFNVAAREAERRGQDRNFVTYVRGAWGQQTDSAGEHVVQYLRTGSTWSAIAEIYENGLGHVVTLAQVLWLRGVSNAAADVKKQYLVCERGFDVRELEPFAAAELDVRTLKRGLTDVHVCADFGTYQERFTRLLEMDSDRVLRLLHKTQSAKNLGDLDTFLRDFMLDVPQTFAAADRLVLEFVELNAAHAAVVSAREQIATLQPAHAESELREQAILNRTALDESAEGLEHFKTRTRQRLLEEGIAELLPRLDASLQKVALLDDLSVREREKHEALRREHQALGGNVLEQLARELHEVERARPDRVRRRTQLEDACKTLAWQTPATVDTFAERVAEARAALLGGDAQRKALEEHIESITNELSTSEREFKEAVQEVRALERQRSNLPARLLDVRSRLAKDIAVSEDRLPFAGELLEVRQDAEEWHGAAERVLGGFARALLVDEDSYDRVARYLNDNHVGERLVYHRMIPHATRMKSTSPRSLVRKLRVAAGAYAEWLHDELAQHFDFECVDDVHALRAAPRAMTRQGQIKHNSTRHEKNDLRRVDDRSQWVLGFDNKEKLAFYQAEASRLSQEIVERQTKRSAMKESLQASHRSDQACVAIGNLTWNDVDVASLLLHAADLRERIVRETSARPALEQLEAQMHAQKRVLDAALLAVDEERALRLDLLNRKQRFEKQLTELGPSVTLTPHQAQDLEQRFVQMTKSLTLDSLDALATQVLRGITAETRALADRIAELKASIERRLAEFNRRWPAESGGLDAVIESAADYFGKLRRLLEDDLPRHEERFMRLLHDQSDQNLAFLATQLDLERSAIHARLELVNESLRSAPFNDGTYLVIQTLDRVNEDVRGFKRAVRDALEHSISPDAQLAEQRFTALSRLVTRLGSHENVDRNWRALVLDVRQHVEFVARELNEDGIEVEVYRSGVGKSGGQRQKLASFCLAAALRYQLSGPDRAQPIYSTVVLDEAFDKADPAFTTMAMNIFTRFGFQMIVATPLKAVMTLEPFIGGASFIDIKDRKHSMALPIIYDESAKRLLLSEHGAHDSALS